VRPAALWPEANRPTIEALIQYAYSQKIIPVKVEPEAVFAPNALTSSRLGKLASGSAGYTTPANWLP
jgi:hypothetical protein